MKFDAATLEQILRMAKLILQQRNATEQARVEDLRQANPRLKIEIIPWTVDHLLLDLLEQEAQWLAVQE